MAIDAKRNSAPVLVGQDGSSIVRSNARSIRPVTGVETLDAWLGTPHSGIREIRQHSAGTQGNGVRTVETEDGLHVVVKWNTDHPEWPRHEAAWQRHLKQTPLGPFIPVVIAETHGGFIMEHVPGEDVRELVIQGVGAEQIQPALKRVLRANEEWIMQQRQQGGPQEHLADNTVQRRQVQDTIRRLHGPLRERLEADVRFKDLFASGDLYTRPFVYNGVEYGSITEITGGIIEHLTSKVPTYILHGDISGNLRLDLKTGTIALFDPEFAGPTPVTEDLVRIAKWRTTKLIEHCSITRTSNHDGKLHVDVGVRFPSNAERLHRNMEEEARAFMERIGEKHAWHQYYLALAGSYLREAVLSIDRGNNDIAMWAFGEMARAYALFDDLSHDPARNQRAA